MAVARIPKVNYPGAKGRLAPALVNLMPSSGRFYFEPFAGRGNVFWAAATKLDFQVWFLNDISTMPFFTAIQETNEFRVPVRTREEYARQKDKFLKGGDNQSILLEPYLTFSGGGYKNGGYGGKKSVGQKGYTNTLIRCKEIMSSVNVQLSSEDWVKVDWDVFTEEDFVFFDPPYYQADVRAYSNDFDHEKMISLLVNAPFKWMLTEYMQEFYLDAFGDPCYIANVQLACDGRGKRRRTECVWSNY